MGRKRAAVAVEGGWWLASGLLVAGAYLVWRPQPPFPGYSLWLEGVSLWLQLAVGPALLLALHRRIARRQRRRAAQSERAAATSAPSLARA